MSIPIRFHADSNALRIDDDAVTIQYEKLAKITGGQVTTNTPNIELLLLYEDANVGQWRW